MPEISTKIAAIFRYPEGKEIVNSSPHGTAYTFEREPTNAYDKNAIKVFGKRIDGSIIQLGYVPKQIAAQLADKRITGITKGDKFDDIRIAFE